MGLHPEGARNLLLDGPFTPMATGCLLADALGLPPAAVVGDDATAAEEEAAWTCAGRIQVHALEPDGDLRVKADVILFDDRPIDFACLPALARRHGLTVAWQANDADQGDEHWELAFPDGRVAWHWLVFDETADSHAVRLAPPRR